MVAGLEQCLASNLNPGRKLNFACIPYLFGPTSGGVVVGSDFAAGTFVAAAAFAMDFAKVPVFRRLAIG